MTRKEERIEASIDYQMSTNPIALGGAAFDDMIRKMNVNPSFVAGAEWGDKTMIVKACEWLKENMSNYIIEHPFSPAGSSVTVEEDKMVEDFRKAMEGEL